MYAQEEKVLFLITYNRRIILPLLLHVGAAKFYHVCVYLEHLLQTYFICFRETVGRIALSWRQLKC